MRAMEPFVLLAVVLLGIAACSPSIGTFFQGFAVGGLALLGLGIVLNWLDEFTRWWRIES